MNQQTQNFEPQFLSDKELCRRWNKTRQSTWEYRKRGLLPFYRLGGSIMYRLSDIEAIELENRRTYRAAVAA